MERHIAKVTALSVGLSLIAGTFAFAAVGGLSMLGLGAVKSVHESLAGPALRQVAPLTTDASGASPTALNAPIFVAVGQSSTSLSSRAASTAAAAVSAEPAALIAEPAAVAPVPPNSPIIVQPEPTSAPTTPAPATVAPTMPKTTTPPTAAPAPATTPTTVPKTTTTVRPPGVPLDWPAGKAIPPMPVPCPYPQLELNGVWNCQD